MSDSPLRRRAVIATRIFMPEPAAASFRLEAVQNALLEDGWDVEVLTTATQDDMPADHDNWSLRVSRWPVLRDSTGYVRGYIPYLSFDIPLFFRLLTTKRPSVVLVEPPPTSGAVTRVATFIRRIPYVWYAADIWSDAVQGAGMNRVVVAALTAVERFAISGASGVIAVSEGFVPRLEELGAKNVRVIPGGINTDLYRPQDCATASPDSLLSPYFLYAGTASEWQGATIFLHAFRSVLEHDPEATLVFVGQGTDWPELAVQAEELNAEFGREAVRVLPPVTPEEIARLQRDALCCLVSIVPHDHPGVPYPYPTKVLSATASGTPVIYAGMGPATEDIRHHRLGLVSDYDEASVAAAMVTMLETFEDYQAADLHRWTHGERSLKTMGRKVARFLETVAERRSPGFARLASPLKKRFH